MRFRIVAAERAQFPVSLLCKTIGVTRQGFYAWRRREPSARSVQDAALLERIRQIHAETNQAYGAPRVYLDLREDHGLRIGKKRVARLMRQAGLRGADGRRGGPSTTIREPAQPSAPDLVDRRFVRSRPNELWVCDLKYVQTAQGFLFLAAVQDVFSRRIVGWSMRDDLQAELVLDALGMAVTSRGTRRRHRPLRSRQPVHQPALRPLRKAIPDRFVDGIGRRSLGQRDGRELLRQPRKGAAQT
jgi:putative transposase